MFFDKNRMMRELDEVFDKAMAANVFTRASLGVVSSDETIFFNVGELNEHQVDETTLFDVASVTKVIPVSTLALIALDRKMVSLDTPVVDIAPQIELKTPQPVLFRHLLTQTLDFQFSLSSFKELAPEDLLNTILTAELKSDPGSSFFYCNATSVLLGVVVENLFDGSLDEIAYRELFEPLGMNKTHFKPEVALREMIIPTEIDSWRGRAIQGEVHDESSWILSEIMIPGAAGLFSNSLDISRYLKMILFNTPALFSDGFLGKCADNWIPEVTGEVAGLGFEYDQHYMGKGRSKKTIGKTGFTGSVLVADLEKKAGFTLLTDYTWPKRKENRDGIMKLRQEVGEVIWRNVR